MESQETWHEGFTDALYSAASSDHREGQLSSAAAPAPQKAARPRKQTERDPRARAAATHSRGPVQQAPPTRPPAGSLPPSLRAIMEGVHPSLREADD